MNMRAIDFFCGTGGFSRGAHAAGFDVVAAFDKDPILTSSYNANFPNTKLVLADIGNLTGDDVRKSVGGEPIDLIFGGPPCQGFSSIGRRNKRDPRRTLLRDYFRLVAELCPSAFVMENVVGLGFPDALPELEAALDQLPPTYRTFGPVILDASDFGAATKRKRLFVFGFDPERCEDFGIDDIFAARTQPSTVAEALEGLDRYIQLATETAFDRCQMIGNPAESAYARRLMSSGRTFSGNMKTAHTPNVIERFSKVKPGEMDSVGRHPRLSLEGQCPTLRAGTGSEMGSYQSVRPIHPIENRVITVREAARLQGFPDDHLFHPTIWHSFRMIGNSVSPIIADKILSVVAMKIRNYQLTQESAKQCAIK